MRSSGVGGVAMIAGVTLLAVVVAGCQSANSGQAGQPGQPGPEEPAATSAPQSQDSATQQTPPTSQPTSPETPTAKPPPQAEIGRCKVGDLQVSLGGGEGAAGTVYRMLIFTNVVDRKCTLQGFPGVSYVAGDDGHQVGQAAFRVGKEGPLITLKPGMAVVAPVGFVQVHNYDPAECRPTPARGLRIYPPHAYKSKFVPMRDATGCAGNPPGHQLTVKTVRISP